MSFIVPQYCKNYKNPFFNPVKANREKLWKNVLQQQKAVTSAD